MKKTWKESIVFNKIITSIRTIRANRIIERKGYLNTLYNTYLISNFSRVKSEAIIKYCFRLIDFETIIDIDHKHNQVIFFSLDNYKGPKENILALIDNIESWGHLPKQRRVIGNPDIKMY